MIIDFATYLLTLSSITDLVSTRIFVDKLPQLVTARPTITVQRISATHKRDHAGQLGIATTRIQLDVWAATAASADAVAEAVRVAVDGVGPITMGTTPIVRAFDDGESSTYNQAIDGSDTGEHRVTQDWIIWHTETTP